MTESQLLATYSQTSLRKQRLQLQTEIQEIITETTEITEISETIEITGITVKTEITEITVITGEIRIRARMVRKENL